MLARGNASEDVLLSLARRGIDVRDKVVTRVDRSAGRPRHGDGWFAVRAGLGRLACASHAALLTPIPLTGLYLLGASMHPGATIPYVAWGAAHAAQLVDAAWISPART